MQVSLELAICGSLSLLAAPTLLGYNAAAAAFVGSKVPAAISVGLVFVYFITQALESWAAVTLHRRRSRIAQHNLDTAQSHWTSQWLTSIRKYLGTYTDNWILVICALTSCLRLLSSDNVADAHTSESVRIALAIAQLFAWYQTFSNAFLPFERFGVFTIVVQQMIIADVITWLVILSPVAFALVIGANAVSPRSAVLPFNWLNNEHNWASIYDSMENMLLMTFVGEPSNVMQDGVGRGGSPWSGPDFSIYPSDRVMQAPSVTLCHDM